MLFSNVSNCERDTKKVLDMIVRNSMNSDLNAMPGTELNDMKRKNTHLLVLPAAICKEVREVRSEPKPFEVLI